MQPYHTSKVSSALLHRFLRFVEIQMQSYHTLQGSRSLLPSLFKVCGYPDATLSHFEGVKVIFTKSF